MAYFIRVLGTSNPDIHLDNLTLWLKSEGISATLELDERESPAKWSSLHVKNANGEPLCVIDRNAIDTDLGKEELKEFREDIKDCKPDSAVKWLTKYFNKVKVIYAFQLLNASFEEENFSIINTLKEVIWNETGGILQADNEGFSNEEGFHILWQFNDSVGGEWNMAVKSIFGWTYFTMDLADLHQRKEFFEGKVPKRAIRF